ncbi:MAG TPA: hypothetical protein VGJ41_07085 [Nocardioides sp.]
MTAVKVVMAVLVGAWVIGGSIWVEDDLLRWIARDVRRDVRRARGLAFWTHSAVVVATPCVMLAGPFVFNLMPSRFSGFQDLRRDLQRRGASKDAARAVAWVGAPFVIVELAVLTVLVIISFVD